MTAGVFVGYWDPECHFTLGPHPKTFKPLTASCERKHNK